MKIMSPRMILVNQAVPRPGLNQSTNDTVSPEHVGDNDYGRFDTGAMTRNKLELSNDMQRYLQDKFTSYVRIRRFKSLCLIQI